MLDFVTRAVVSDLPAYSLRESGRARNIRLCVTAREGLVLVVPAGWRGDADAIVASKRVWAERALSGVAQRRAQLLAGPEALLPSTVPLRAFAEEWPVEYRDGSAASASARERGGVLRVTGPVHDAEKYLHALDRWLSRVASERLPARVRELAEAHGCAPAAVRVRKTRSRWGSCSARATISLNRNLVFLPVELVDALMRHELAHLSHLNHSAHFWAHLASLDPDVVRNRERLRRADDFVPAWAEA